MGSLISSEGIIQHSEDMGVINKNIVFMPSLLSRAHLISSFSFQSIL